MQNQLYIESTLSGILNQMMIATLNRMPEEPSEFMKEYISLHYLDMNQSEKNEDEEMQMKRERLGKNDLNTLRAEVDELKDQHAKF